VLVQQFKRLHLHEKVLVIGLILSFLFTFLDWFFQVNITPVANELGKYEDIKTFNAYEGIIAVIGYFYSILTLSALVAFILSLKEKMVSKFIEKRHWLFLFLTGESLFLLVLAFLIYTSYSMQYSRAGVRHGLILLIITNIVTLFASHYYFIQRNRIKLKSAFESQLGKDNINIDFDEVTNKKNKQDDTLDQMTLADYNEEK